ncbi:MAG: hypothetical protein ACRDYX_15450 [Egibacteraceae bacterium]
MQGQWEHRVELFGMQWRRQERLPDAEGLQRKLNEWGVEGWELVAFEMVRDEYVAVGGSQAAADPAPTAAYLVILKRPKAP